MIISKFSLDNNLRVLAIEFSVSSNKNEANAAKLKNAQLSFEYLRISTPDSSGDKSKSGQPQPIAHKKDVALINIESVAKHGYRFIFNDNHKAVYSEAYIQTLVEEYDSRWQAYLSSLKISGHSREAMINFKQL